MRRWIPAVAILALLAAGFFLIRPAPELGSFTMSDGTVFELVKITTGRSHRYHYGNRWQDYLGYVVPKALRAKLKSRLLEINATNANSLVVWTKSQGRPPVIQGFEISVEDQSGVEVPVGAMDFPGLAQRPSPLPRGFGPATFVRRMIARPTTMGQASSNIWVAGWLIAPLPHHSHEIGLGFYDAQRRAGYFKLPNPSYRRARGVKTDNLPLVKSARDIQMKLITVEVTRNPQNTSRVDWAVSAEVLRDGAPVSDWQLESVDVLSDGELFAQAGSTMRFGMGGFSGFGGGGGSFSSVSSSSGFQTTGGRGTSPSFSFSSSGSSGPRFPPARFLGGAQAPMQPLPGLWPDAVWTVRLWAVQRDNFAPDQIWILNNVPVTNAMEWKVERSEQRQVSAKKVELLGFRGPQVTWSSPRGGSGRSTSGSAGDVNVCFAAPPQSEGVRITFLRGRDDQGRTLDRAGNSYGNSTAPWTIPPPAPSQPEVMIYGFSVRPAPDAKSLTLEFAVHQARSVDFVVKPAFQK